MAVRLLPVVHDVATLAGVDPVRGRDEAPRPQGSRVGPGVGLPVRRVGSTAGSAGQRAHDAGHVGQQGAGAVRRDVQQGWGKFHPETRVCLQTERYHRNADEEDRDAGDDLEKKGGEKLVISRKSI